jgi:hypothetical protein
MKINKLVVLAFSAIALSSICIADGRDVHVFLTSGQEEI